MHVKTDESVVSAIERNGLRSLLKRPTNSAARCWQSAALPPLPHQKNLHKRHVDNKEEILIPI